MYMGESDPTASQPSKPVCDWILGRAEVDVKEKSFASTFTRKEFVKMDLR
jgi:hypothetical protein